MVGEASEGPVRPKRRRKPKTMLGKVQEALLILDKCENGTWTIQLGDYVIFRELLEEFANLLNAHERN
jgi:hypothetical protein